MFWRFGCWGSIFAAPKRKKEDKDDLGQSEIFHKEFIDRRKAKGFERRFERIKSLSQTDRSDIVRTNMSFGA